LITQLFFLENDPFSEESIKSVQTTFYLVALKRMNKKTTTIIILVALALLLLSSYFAVFKASLNNELAKKNSEINNLTNQVLELQKQLDDQQKPSLVTALGISTEPRNVTYPHPHFTIEGSVLNVGNRTAYNAKLDVIAYYKNGLSALKMSIPLGDIGKYQIVQVSKITATSDWIGNYTVTPVCTDIP
jgi:cell division protein FtsL